MGQIDRFKAWLVGRLTAPTKVDRELAWRGYVLNTLLLGLILFTIPFLALNIINWVLGLDSGSAIGAFVALLAFIFLYWLSRHKSVSLAIFLFSLLCVAISFFLSLGWGVTDIATTAFYVMAIIQTSILLRRWNFVCVLGALMVGYLAFGWAELSGWYTPLFYTELTANYINVSILLLFLIFVGYVTSRLVDQVLAVQVAETARRQELESRTKIAAEVQMSMLPAQSPTYPGFDIAGQSIPARDVGGDFYNYHQLASGELAIVIGDVTGKGMSAALLMAVTTGMIDSLIPATTEPTDLLGVTATRLQKHSQRSGLTTACLVAFLKEGGALCVANAGCIAPIIRRHNGQVEWLNVRGLPMGVEVDRTQAKYEQAEATLAPGDWVIFTTDGVVESQSQYGEILGFDRLETIVSSGPTHSAQALKSHIINQVRSYQDSTEQHDDMTVVVVQVKEDSPRVA